MHAPEHGHIIVIQLLCEAEVDSIIQGFEGK
ncbi:unnamed protein product, partial [Rotaria sordida]